MNREDALYNARHLSKTYHNLCNDTEGFWEAVINALEKEPSGQTKPGTWRMDIDHSRGFDWRRFYCSECGEWQTYGEPKFCPKCGARMETKEDESV